MPRADVIGLRTRYDGRGSFSLCLLVMNGDQPDSWAEACRFTRDFGKKCQNSLIDFPKIYGNMWINSNVVLA